MRNILSILIMFIVFTRLSITVIHGQTGMKSISGIVADSIGAGIRVATVTLKSASGRIVSIVQTNDSGSFVFNGLPAGSYQVAVTSVGYQFHISDTIRLSADTVALYNIILRASAKMLDEVVVASRRQALTIERGKLVLNIQNSSLAVGSSALELVKRLPGITTDQDENIVLRGSAVNVMIDGKMTYLSGKQLTNFLTGMTGENLSKLELISSPGADFDAAGNAGIINIVTKHDRREGYSVDLRSGISRGRYWMTNQNVTANYNTRVLKLYGQFDFNTPHVNFKGHSSNSVNDSGRMALLSRQTNRSYKINFYTYEAGVEWAISERHQLTARYNGHFDDFVAPKRSDVTKYNSDNTSTSVRATTNIIEPYHFDHLNLGYRYLFDSAGASLTLDMHWMKYKNFSDGYLLSEPVHAVHGTPGDAETLFFHQPGFITIRSGKADLLLPFKKASVKAGIKASLVTNDNQYRFDSLSQGTLVEASSMSNHFKYRETILAGYLSVSKQLKRTSFEAGIRVEHTDARGYTVKADVNNRWNYLQLFPSISVDHKIGDNSKLNISVSRRINRPQYNDLNPVRWYNDPYFYYSGNPDLQAELAWVFSTAFSFKNGLSLTGTFNHRTNFISVLLAPDNQTTAIKSVTANFREMNRIDLLALLPVRITDFWNANVNGTITHTSYPLSVIGGFRHLALWSTSFRLQQQLSLPAQLQMEVSAIFVSDELQGIYRRSQNFYADIGIKKSMLRNRLNILLNYTDFLRTNRYKAESLSNFTDYQIYERKDTNRFGISVRYHIGNSSGNNRSNKTEEQERM